MLMKYVTDSVSTVTKTQVTVDHTSVQLPEPPIRVVRPAAHTSQEKPCPT